MLVSAFLVATPLFGLSLSLDPSIALMPASGPLVLDLDDATVGADEELDAAPPSDEIAPDEVARLMERRAQIGRIHKWMGIATWASMTVTVALGMIQDWNLYGFFASQGNTPCVKGNAVFGQDACLDTPLPHLISASITGALYFTTFGLSFGMPDPLHLDQGDSVAAQRLRRHKRLRWAHFSGMIAQVLLGVVLANNDAFGLDRANHYTGLEALSIVHMLTGLSTYGTLTWAGATMLQH